MANKSKNTHQVKTLKAGAAGLAHQTLGRSRSWGGKKPEFDDSDEVEEMINDALEEREGPSYIESYYE